MTAKGEAALTQRWVEGSSELNSKQQKSPLCQVSEMAGPPSSACWCLAKGSMASNPGTLGSRAPVNYLERAL